VTSKQDAHEREAE
jgi:hypothetical protein